MADIVARDIAKNTIQFYFRMIHIYTGGSKKGISTTAAYVVPKSEQFSKPRLSYCHDTTTAQLAAMWLTFTNRSEHNKKVQLVILTDSRGAFLQLENLKKATPLAKNIAQLVRNMANQENTTDFQ